MNIITGYLGATQGTVEVNGYDIFKNPEEAKRSIGYLPELPPLYPDMKVDEYLSFVADLKMIEQDKREKQIEKVIERSGIGEVRGRLVADDTTENLMNGGSAGQELKLLVRGDGRKTADIIETVPGVESDSVSLKAGDEKGTSDVIFRATEGKDIRNAVISKLDNGGIIH
jgi:hypothetical protein